MNLLTQKKTIFLKTVLLIRMYIWFWHLFLFLGIIMRFLHFLNWSRYLWGKCTLHNKRVLTSRLYFLLAPLKMYVQYITFLSLNIFHLKILYVLFFPQDFLMWCIGPVISTQFLIFIVMSIIFCSIIYMMLVIIT